MKTLTTWAILWLTSSLCLMAQEDSFLHTGTSLKGLESYIDSLMELKMEEQGVPGAVISIVKDSQEVFYKAYGFANLETKRKVNKDKTGFRIASISKTFLATAALQLVEQGKLDLHADIRTYLPDDDFSFLDYAPMTMHQLLTHTAGIDISDIGDAARTPEEIIPLEQLARYHIPKQVHIPGRVHAYSNFGYSLAGYIIQLISGQSYEGYIQEHILDPLDMVNSSNHQPPPAAMGKEMAQAYKWEGYNRALPPEYLNTFPAGAVNATAKDMLNYLIMHINGGIFKGKRILGPASHRNLTSQQYGSKRTKFGICYSFFEGLNRGKRSLYHGGAVPGFISNMVIVPESGTGIFIAQNNRGSGWFSPEMVNLIMDTLLTNTKPTYELPEPPKGFEQKAKNFVGYYKQMNYPKSTFEKAQRLFGQFSAEFPVSYEGEGILKFRDIPFVEIEENLFQIRNKNSPWKIEFLLDEEGKGIGFFNGLISYERIPWFKQSHVLQKMLWSSVFALLIFVLSWLIPWTWKKFKRRKTDTSPKPIYLKWLLGVSLFYLSGIAGILLSDHFIDQLTDFGIPFSLKLSFLMLTTGAIGALFSPFILWKCWINPDIVIWKKVPYTILILAIAILSLMFWEYNLLGLQY